MSAPDDQLSEAYAFCRRMARTHYENFPVASRLLPARIRPAVAVIYAFARQADDMADEGDLAPEQRLRFLDAHASELERTAVGVRSRNPVFLALGDVLRRHALPVSLFTDLLDAFRQDVVKSRYRDFGEVADYCRRSANPVGRLLLHLTGHVKEHWFQWSDDTCTGLQLTNFLQDLRSDLQERGRIYLPEDVMARHGVTEEHIREGRCNEAVRALAAEEIGRARGYLERGAPLGTQVGGRFGLELRLITQAGLRALEKLERGANVFEAPRLRVRDGVLVVGRVLLAKH